MKNHHYRKYWLFIGTILILIVFYLCLKKPGKIEVMFPLYDKLSHCFAYLLLSWWFYQLFRKPKSISIAFILMSILIEFLQEITSYRFFELADIAANTSGVILGMTIFTRIFKDSLLQIDNKIFAYLNRKRTL